MKTNMNVTATRQSAELFPQISHRRFAKRRHAGNGALLLLAILAQLTTGFGQNYSIDWYKISGGGGTSTGGTYQVSGTIGQHDAGGPMTGGSYSLTGGFWALISVVQTPGLPNLIVTHSGNSVIVSWPDPATNSYTLQQNASLSNSGGWVTSGYSITPANGTNSITVNPPTGNLFFRLKQ
jgi:hypothetical protein